MAVAGWGLIGQAVIMCLEKHTLWRQTDLYTAYAAPSATFQENVTITNPFHGLKMYNKIWEPTTTLTTQESVICNILSFWKRKTKK